MQVILAVLAVWFLLRPKTAEPSASSAVGVVPVEGITNKDAQAVAEALNGFPPSTPRETSCPTETPRCAS